MNIVIDARVPHTGGIYSYSRALLRAMLEVDERNRYTVLYDKSHGALGLDGCREIVVDSDNPLKWLVWNHTALPKLLQAENADVYHSYKQISLRKSRAKKILTVHSAYPYLFKRYCNLQERIYWRPMIKAGARSADGVISVADSDASSLAECLAIPKEKIHVTPLAADPRFKVIEDETALRAVEERLGLPQRYIVYVGTIYPVKNVETVVRVYHRVVKNTGLDIGLVLVGRTGWGGDSVDRVIDELGLRSKVVFTGNQSTDLPHLYTRAELLLFPSYYEAFCAPPLESMACGTPVVASTRGGIPEVVGDCGLLREPDDIEGLAECCAKILTDPAFKADLVRRGFERAGGFTWNQCALKTLRAYEQVCANPTKP